MKHLLFFLMSLFFASICDAQVFNYESKQRNVLCLFGLDEDGSKYGKKEISQVSVEFSFGDKISIKGVEGKKVLWSITDIFYVDLSFPKDIVNGGKYIDLSCYLSKEKFESSNPDVMMMIFPHQIDFKFEPGEDGDLMGKCINYILENSQDQDNSKVVMNKNATNDLLRNFSTYKGETVIIVSKALGDN